MVGDLKKDFMSSWKIITLHAVTVSCLGKNCYMFAFFLVLVRRYGIMYNNNYSYREFTSMYGLEYTSVRFLAYSYLVSNGR